MTMADAAIGLANVATKVGLRGYDKWPAGTPQTPCAIVVWTGGTYNQVMGRAPRKMNAQALLVLVMDLKDPERAQAEALKYMEPDGEKSLVKALDSDPRLGRRVDDAQATGFDRYEPQMVSGVDFMCPAIQVGVVF